MSVQTRMHTVAIRFRAELGVLALYDVLTQGLILRESHVDDEEKSALRRLVCFVCRAVSSRGYRRRHLYEHNIYISLIGEISMEMIVEITSVRLRTYLLHFLNGTTYPVDLDLLGRCMTETDFQGILFRIGISIRRRDPQGPGYYTLLARDPVQPANSEADQSEGSFVLLATIPGESD
jgi:hypothetical protein